MAKQSYQKPKVYGRYSEKRTKFKTFNPENPKERSKTQQHFKEAVDINNIISRHVKHGKIERYNINRVSPIYADVSNIEGYQEALQKVNGVDALFGQLPAEVRKRFENDPSKVLDFVSNPENKAEAQRLGLLQPDIAPVKYVDEQGNDITAKREAEIAKEKTTEQKEQSE